MATPRPGFDREGNRRNNRFTPATDNDTAMRSKSDVIAAIIAFTAPDTINAGVASGVLTLAANVINTEIVTIDAKVYTFQTVLTNVDGNVLIGAAATDSIDNLIAAITLGAGSGTLYAALTTLHPTVTAVAGAGDTMDAFAKTGGVAGNSIVSTEGSATASWAAATLLGGLAAPANGIAEFEVGDAIEVLGSVGQNGNYVVATVAAGIVTLVEQTITTEMVGASVTVRVTNNRNLNRFAA